MRHVILEKYTLRVVFMVFAISPMAFAPGNWWGFWAHKRINRLAVFRLPPPMISFYKQHIDFLTENAVNPDKRRYAVVGEAERHYIDLDRYGDSASYILPKGWPQAVKKFGEDSLRKHGIVPWYIQTAAFQLTDAMKNRDEKRILRISADIGHYIADAHVPLHTTQNYNGQLSGQNGIHGFWESRLPELFAEDYDLWIGRATYIDDIATAAWNAVTASHAACDSVLQMERILTAEFPPDRKFTYEMRNNVLTRSYSRDFSERYHALLQDQVRRRMRDAIRMVGDVWYTCWVNAGQPELLVPNKKEVLINDEATPVERLREIRPEGD